MKIILEELEFRKHLRRVPHDANCRLVYADWLEDRGELEQARRQREMVPGFAALHALKREICYLHKIGPYNKQENRYSGPCMFVCREDTPDNLKDIPVTLPDDWCDLIFIFGCEYEDINNEPAHWFPYYPIHELRDNVTYLELSEAIAYAFAGLPKEKQELYLSGRFV